MGPVQWRVRPAVWKASLWPLSGALVTVAGTALVVASCRPPLPTPELTYRHEREQTIRSALAPAALAHFKGLRFYPFDPACEFRAMFEPIVPPEPLEIAASDGSTRRAHRVGRVRLGFPSGTAVLTIFQLDDLRETYPDDLFLPFRDAGAGKETYGAGRYVDVKRLPGGVVSINFNRAYNPDCAYGISGQCPITPPENTLPFAVKAGEMIPPGQG
jgi:uncharacterized protein (DUF1684 family)